MKQHNNNNNNRHQQSKSSAPRGPAAGTCRWYPAKLAHGTWHLYEYSTQQVGTSN